MMIPLRALIKRDLRLFFADRRAVIMSFIAPIAIASFFGYIFNSDKDADPAKIAVLMVDRDNSAISKAILTDLQSNKSLDVKASELDAAREAVRKGKASVAVVVPENFGADAGRAFFRPGNKPQIGMLYDPSHKPEEGMVQGILTGSVMQVVSKEVFGGETGQSVVKESLNAVDQSTGLDPGDKKSLHDLLQGVSQWNDRARSSGASGQALAGGIRMPYEIHEEAVTSRSGAPYNSFAHSFAGMSVQFILFVGVEVGIGLLLQRQRGLWRRLRAAPLSRGLLLGSRAISAAMTSMMVLFVVFGFAKIVFNVGIEGSMIGFIGVCIAFSFMTASFGLLIAALGKTPEATRGLSIFVTLIMVMLGGAWVPAFIFPKWLQTATLFVPTRWAVDGLDAMSWRGLPLSDALMPIGALLLSTLIFGGIAISRFRWESEG